MNDFFISVSSILSITYNIAVTLIEILFFIHNKS